MSKRKLPPQENPMKGEFAPPPERQFYTVAFLCAMLQQPPAFIHELMRLCEVGFVYTENGVGMIRGDDVQKMAATLADKRAEVESFASN